MDLLGQHLLAVGNALSSTRGCLILSWSCSSRKARLTPWPRHTWPMWP